MIKNIVFDVGKVLVSFDAKSYMRKLGYNEITCKSVNAAMFAHSTWNECDRGVLSTKE